MEHRIERIKEIKLLLENEINKRELILTKYKKIKNTFGVIGKVSAVITASTGVGGIITASTIALLPVSITLDSVAVVCGLSLLLSTKLYDCISTKIEKHRCIKLLAISKLGEIYKIIGEDEDIDAKEFNTIINHYEEFHKLKADIQNKHKSNIN
jgi:hypothetical protein